MEEALLNNELALTVPEGFSQMDTLELARASFTDRAPFFSIRDPERHISVTAAWKRVGKLRASLTSPLAAAKRSERNFSAAMQTRAYRSGELSAAVLGGREAAFYRCAYRAEGVEMTGISLVCRGRDSVYYIHGYFRSDSLEQSLPVWEVIVKSARWNEE